MPTSHSHQHSHLYVDTDDTLILYRRGGTNPYGFLNKIEWDLNTGLIEAINLWANENNALVRLWSGGGAHYAKHVYQQVKAQIPFPVDSFETKFRLTRHDASCDEQHVSAFIDDDLPWVTGGLRKYGLAHNPDDHIRVFEPESFVETVRSGDFVI